MNDPETMRRALEELAANGVPKTPGALQERPENWASWQAFLDRLDERVRAVARGGLGE